MSNQLTTTIYNIIASCTGGWAIMFIVVLLTTGCASFKSDVRDLATVMEEVCNKEGTTVSLRISKSGDREAVRGDCTWAIATEI